MNCCPVCGEFLEPSDSLNNMIHLTLCFDEGIGHQVMTGRFMTDKQASYGWVYFECETFYYYHNPTLPSTFMHEFL